MTTDGKSLKNLHQLSLWLQSANNEKFKIHVNTERNDFWNWVYGSLRDDTLARQIKDVKGKMQMANIVHKRVIKLQKEHYADTSELRKHIKYGMREFTAGIVIGILGGIMIAGFIGV